MYDLLDAIRYREPKPPRQIKRHDARSELERICLKCLSKRMTDRYATALDLAEELRLWMAESADSCESHRAGRASCSAQGIAILRRARC